MKRANPKKHIFKYAFLTGSVILLAIGYYIQNHLMRQPIASTETKQPTVESSQENEFSVRGRLVTSAGRLNNTTTVGNNRMASPEEKPLVEGMKTHSHEAALSGGNVIDERLKEIELFIAISQEQREKLQTFFEKAVKRRNDMAMEGVLVDPHEAMADETQTLTEILGPEGFLAYETGRQERNTALKTELVEKEVSQLSSKLSLGTEQENSVREAIKATREEMTAFAQTYFEQKRFELTQAGDDTSAMKLLEEIEEQTQQALNSRLKGVLTETQYNKLLEDQGLH